MRALKALPNGVFEFNPHKAQVTSGGTTCNILHIPAGASVGKHVHDYDHLSCLVSGEVVVCVPGQDEVHLSGFKIIEIEAHKSHSIHAIEDSVWMCIHSSKDDSEKLKVGV